MDTFPGAEIEDVRHVSRVEAEPSPEGDQEP
jgi:hypothetical protein